MKDFKERYGPWALVTGASAGIGAEFAKQLAARRMNLMLVARRKDRLDQLKEKLEAQFFIQVKTITADLADEKFMEKIRPEIAAVDLGLLINNAGFANTGEFLTNHLEKELELLYVNCRAPMILGHEIGIRLKQRKSGGIIFTSSMVSAAPMPYWATYSASKAFDLFLAEAMHWELKDSGVDVLALCPGGTNTEFQQVANIHLPGMSVKHVVQLALERLGKKSSVIPGVGNRMRYVSLKVLPKFISARAILQVMKRLAKSEV
ncbi:SDR family NAD(P)-dependent oxidoreductase [Fodinisporobacter ferrooxydans]|uniref:NADP-dependent 3-hydroxy acid dehydrogenase YdfG n=1 Tax=Fodinisporobacter ferrooxydans TaxID=2901836 RepID=A0ABY4CDK5_9BACL|nr:SDR family NAD(P)-dependent oxidoreductase [Alicyclobacillaceae bacterium MYW30-H2]